MNEQALFLVDVIERLDDRYLNVKVTHQDGTTDELRVERYKLHPIEGSNPPKAWLDCEFAGERGGLASIELPYPILNKGKRLTVETARIKRRSMEEELASIPRKRE